MPDARLGSEKRKCSSRVKSEVDRILYRGAGKASQAIQTVDRFDGRYGTQTSVSR